MQRQAAPDWIQFDEGKYRVDQAYLTAGDSTGLQLENPAIHITTGRGGRKYLQGICTVRNTQVVELLEATDDLDILLDLGGEFIFLIEKAEMQAGKVFSPGVRSTLRFSPSRPWKQLSRNEFNKRLQGLEMIDNRTASG